MIQALCFSVTILDIIISLYREKILDIHIAIMTMLLGVQEKLCFYPIFVYCHLSLASTRLLLFVQKMAL